MAEEDRRLEVYPPIYKLGDPGKWLRRQLMNGELYLRVHCISKASFLWNRC